MARRALAVRHRQTQAFSRASPHDTRVADLGRGFQIAWLGVLPQHRLPPGALVGLLILTNGAPIRYGDAARLRDGIDGGGIGVFEPFRHGEPAFHLHRHVAFLHQHRGIRAIPIGRWDIGHDNPAGIETRAFWSRDRLGFRPQDEGLRRLAAREFQRIRPGQGAGARARSRSPRLVSQRTARRRGPDQDQGRASRDRPPAGGALAPSRRHPRLGGVPARWRRPRPAPARPHDEPGCCASASPGFAPRLDAAEAPAQPIAWPP